MGNYACFYVPMTESLEDVKKEAIENTKFNLQQHLEFGLRDWQSMSEYYPTRAWTRRTFNRQTRKYKLTLEGLNNGTVSPYKYITGNIEKYKDNYYTLIDYMSIKNLVWYNVEDRFFSFYELYKFLQNYRWYKDSVNCINLSDDEINNLKQFFIDYKGGYIEFA